MFYNQHLIIIVFCSNGGAVVRAVALQPEYPGDRPCCGGSRSHWSQKYLWKNALLKPSGFVWKY